MRDRGLAELSAWMLPADDPPKKRRAAGAGRPIGY